MRYVPCREKHVHNLGLLSVEELEENVARGHGVSLNVRVKLMLPPTASFDLPRSLSHPQAHIYSPHSRLLCPNVSIHFLPPSAPSSCAVRLGDAAAQRAGSI